MITEVITNNHHSIIGILHAHVHHVGCREVGESQLKAIGKQASTTTCTCNLNLTSVQPSKLQQPSIKCSRICIVNEFTYLHTHALMISHIQEFNQFKSLLQVTRKQEGKYINIIHGRMRNTYICMVWGVEIVNQLPDILNYFHRSGPASFAA